MTLWAEIVDRRDAFLRADKANRATAMMSRVIKSSTRLKPCFFLRGFMDAPDSAGAEYSELPGLIAQTYPDCL